MNQPISKSTLTKAQSDLVDLLQRLNFGRIESLLIRSGEPVFDPAPRIVQKLKMGGENGPRPEAGLQDFWLKRNIVEMLQAIANLGDGEILAIEVKHGLPFSMEVEHRRERTAGGRHG